MLAAATFVVAATTVGSPASVANADSSPSWCDDFGRCIVKANESVLPKKQENASAPQNQSDPVQGQQSSRNSGVESSDTTDNAARKAAAELQSKIRESVAQYEAALTRQIACLGVNVPVTQTGNASTLCPGPTRPAIGGGEVAIGTVVGDPAAAVDVNAPPVAVITPEQAAYMAVAQLQLPMAPPGVGPDPKLNEWGMAVVGYPIWLWADGSTHVGPVSQAVANLRVSLDATVAKTVYRMGDGTTVTCTGSGTRWTKAVKSGANSPSCGHVYEKPSLPKGKYTVTATSYWDVAWSVNGATGVISMPMTSSVEVPVGELQVLVTR